jgi:dCTP diphosphatase
MGECGVLKSPHRKPGEPRTHQEILELFLWAKDDGPQPALPERRARLDDEAADALICLLNLCDRAGVELPAAFWQKLAKNEERYPVERARGSLRKHDE